MDKKSIIFIFCVFAVMLFIQSQNAGSILRSKANDQRVSISSFERWRSAYEVLKPIEDRWNDSFVHIESVSDLISLYEKISAESFGLFVNVDMLSVSSVSRVNFNKQPIPLVKACIHSAKNKGVVFSSSSLDRLLDGIDKMNKRTDVEFDSIVISLNNNVPEASLNNFCLLLRDG